MTLDKLIKKELSELIDVWMNKAKFSSDKMQQYNMIIF